MSIRRWATGAAAAALALPALLAASPGPAAAAPLTLREPSNPLRAAWGLSVGVQLLDDADYRDFFDTDHLVAWTLRGDLRVWRSLRLGLALSASDTSEREDSVAVGSEHYPILFNYSAAQTMGEIYLRAELPTIAGLHPHLVAGGLLSRVHAQSAGFTAGYDALWEEYRPATEVRQNSLGWRGGIGIQRPIWANVNLVLEGSWVELEAYGRPVDRDPPVGLWDHGGWRLETGILQHF
jgi:hypothetical protein